MRCLVNRITVTDQVGPTHVVGVDDQKVWSSRQAERREKKKAEKENDSLAIHDSIVSVDYS